MTGSCRPARLSTVPGLGAEYAAQFDDPSVVAAYAARPPYPEALIDWIVAAAGLPPPRIVDLGCGTGELTRRLAPRTAAITAIDRSARMIDRARSLPGGDAPNITWVLGAIEQASIAGEFDLAIAAESFHWFDWPRACRRVRDCVRGATLLIVEGRFEVESPWADRLTPLLARFSTNREFQPYDLVTELESRGHVRGGDRARWRHTFAQSIDDYVLSIHSRNGFSRDRMTAAAASAFDHAARRLVAAFARHDTLTLTVETRATWAVARSRQEPARAVYRKSALVSRRI